VRDSVAEAAGAVRDEGTSAAGDIADRTQQSAQNVRQQADGGGVDRPR
jgi:hypothetical protein